MVEASIIPSHQYPGHDLLNGEPTRRPIGTGPFRFVSYAPAEHRAGAQPDYFRKGLPGVDRLVFRIFPNPASAVAALENGEVDYTVSVPGPDIRCNTHPALPSSRVPADRRIGARTC